MYKKISVGLIILASIFCLGMSNSYNTAPWQMDDLLSASTASGSDGTAVQYIVPLEDFTCAAVWSGTTPTNIVYSIKGSLDAVSYGTYTTRTMTSSPDVFKLIDYPTIYMLASFDTASNGGAATALTVKCLGVGR